MLQNLKPKRRYEHPFYWEKLPVRKGTISVLGASNCHPHRKFTYRATDHRPCYVHGLPFEILSEIFYLSISWRSNFRNPHSYLSNVKHGDTPLSLLSVCRNWRAVALATPSLWHSIYPSWNSLPCMKFWLEVAPPVPFHLKIVDPDLDYGVYPQFPCLMLQLFASVSHRWKSLSITLNPSLVKELLSILESPEKAPLPVESLILDMSDGKSLTSDAISAVLRLLPLLPHLKSLDLGTDVYNHRFDLQSIPWSTLELVKLRHGLTTTEAFSCLTQCTSATKIDFRDIQLLPQEHLQSEFLGKQPVTLPLLTSLTLTRGADPMTIFQYLTLPSIRLLCIGFVNRNHLVLDKFLARTPTLETLVLDDAARGGAYSPAASDEDIVTYFLDSHLRRIPSVYLSFKGAHKRVPMIIEEYPNARDIFPQMICWEAPFDPEETKKIPFSGRELLGWDNNLDSHPRWRLFWLFRDGRVELPPPRRRASTERL